MKKEIIKLSKKRLTLIESIYCLGAIMFFGMVISFIFKIPYYVFGLSCIILGLFLLIVNKITQKSISLE